MRKVTNRGVEAEVAVTSRVLADNLRHAMERAQLSQNELARRSKIPQTTISLLLNPQRREPRKSGRMPGPTLAQLDALAPHLSVAVWELLRPMTPKERMMYEAIERAYRELHSAAALSSNGA